MASGRYRVMLTRAGDSYVALRERVARAQVLKADLFLSIHADSHPIRECAAPRSIHCPKKPPTARPRRWPRAKTVPTRSSLAFRWANQSDTVAAALVAMSQRGTLNDSCRLADTIVSTFGQNGVRLLPRTHRKAGFAVLTSPTSPPPWSSWAIFPMSRTRSF